MVQVVSGSLTVKVLKAEGLGRESVPVRRQRTLRIAIGGVSKRFSLPSDARLAEIAELSVQPDILELRSVPLSQEVVVELILSSTSKTPRVVTVTRLPLQALVKDKAPAPLAIRLPSDVVLHVETQWTKAKDLTPALESAAVVAGLCVIS